MQDCNFEKINSGKHTRKEDLENIILTGREKREKKRKKKGDKEG